MSPMDTYSVSDFIHSNYLHPILFPEKLNMLLESDGIRGVVGLSMVNELSSNVTSSCYYHDELIAISWMSQPTSGTIDYDWIGEVSKQISAFDRLKSSVSESNDVSTLGPEHCNFGLKSLIASVLYKLELSGQSVASLGYTEEGTYLIQLYEEDDYLLLELYPTNDIGYSRRFPGGGKEFGELTMRSLSQKLEERSLSIKSSRLISGLSW